MPLNVDPTSPSAPGQLRVLPRRDVDVCITVPFDEALEYDRARGHVDAQRQGFCCEDSAHETLLEERFDYLLEPWEQTCVMSGEPALERIDLYDTPSTGAMLWWGERGPALPGLMP